MVNFNFLTRIERLDTETKVQGWVDAFIAQIDAVDDFLLQKLVEYENEFDKMAKKMDNKLVKLGFEDPSGTNPISEENDSVEFTKEIIVEPFNIDAGRREIILEKMPVLKKKNTV
jgi:hypothetical protein